MSVYFLILNFFIVLTININASQVAQNSKNKFIVVTDLEPDDRIALHVLAAKIPKDEILFIGTTVKNAARKKVLTRKLLDQLDLKDIPLYQGSGGSAESYHDIASSRAAREYSQEGEEILSIEERNKLEHACYSNTELQGHIKNAFEKYNDIQFILLAPPTDLVAVLEKEPSLKKNIKHIYIMGGWAEIKEGELRTTYNWNMDPEASAKLMKMNDIPMTLYSSHSIKKSFNGGSCNINNSTAIINCMDELKSKMPSLHDQEIAALSWDNHIIAKIPALKNIIEPYKGKQFTPADPLVIVGIINHDLIALEEPVYVNIDLNDLDKAKGFRVYVEPNASSKIKLVEKIDVDVFKQELIKSLYALSKV
jgi:inosine-uridine nucleoside N-ribohydrolase